MIFKNEQITSALYLKITFYIGLSGAMILFSNNIYIHILSMMILTFGAISLVRYDIAHPYFWFSFVFLLYSISYPILYLNDRVYDVYIYTKSLMFSQWLALSVFLLVVGPIRVKYSKLKETETRLDSSKAFLLIISLFLFMAILEISTGGYANKGEIYANGSILISISFRLVLVFLILFAVNIATYALNNNKIDYKITIYVGFIIFLMVFYSGERDLLIRFFIILFYIYYIIVKKSKLSKEVLFLGTFSLALIPILHKYKYFGLTGEKTIMSSNLFFGFLTSDFMSASKNMQILLLDESAKGIFRGKTFLSAILRSFNLDKLPGVNVVSSIQWYNDTYFGIKRAGQGFTLVGDGYVNFGLIGIIILFLFIGLLVRMLYLRSAKGLYHFVFYILSIPIFMYAIRADLVNILTPLIKHNLLVIVLLHIFESILNYTKKYRKSLY